MHDHDQSTFCAVDSEEAEQIAQRCQELLHQPHAGEAVASVWGSGAGLVLEETRSAVSRLLSVGDLPLPSCPALQQDCPAHVRAIA